jgi:hypothetical protein
MGDYYYTTTYQLGIGNEILPVVFTTKKSALEYAKKFGLKGYTLIKETESGVGDYSIPIK